MTQISVMEPEKYDQKLNLNLMKLIYSLLDVVHLADLFICDEEYFCFIDHFDFFCTYSLAKIMK
jgi:hypothetical protein